MQLAVTPFSVASIPSLLDAGADIIVAGNGRFANRLTTSFSELELQDIRAITHTWDAKFYVQVNMIVHQQDITELERYLNFISDLEVDAIIFGDVAVYQIAKQNGYEHRLIYNPETLNTNYYDAVFWGRKGIKGITIAKEIPLEDMIEFKEHTTIELSMIGHGHLNMFHSRRPLIENFFKYNEEQYSEYVDNRQLRLVEEIRNEAYPVFQDNHGTHIFRDKIMASYADIDALNEVVDVLIIDGIFKDTAYVLETVTNYRLLLNTNDKDKAIQLTKQYETNHDTGFLHKKTVYQKGGEKR